MNDRQDYEPCNAQELIDNLNAAFAQRPVHEATEERNSRAEEAAFLRYFKALGDWERTVWNPAYEAVKEADIKLKFDHIAGRYYARYDADGKERYAIRITTSHHFDVMVSADDEEEAKEIAYHAFYRERKTAKHLNKKARFTTETKAENTSVTE